MAAYLTFMGQWSVRALMHGGILKMENHRQGASPVDHDRLSHHLLGADVMGASARAFPKMGYPSWKDFPFPDAFKPLHSALSALVPRYAGISLGPFKPLLAPKPPSILARGWPTESKERP